MKILLTIEYNGAAFAGWQKQDNLPLVPTIQGELERAINLYFNSLAKKNNTSIELPYITLQGSGRTDAGVHAKGQCADFTTPDGIDFEIRKIPVALNGIIDKNIAIRRAQIVPDDFNSRLSVHSKCYSYKFLLQREHPVLERGFGWSVGTQLDIKAMIEVARLFSGTHNFIAFRAADCNSTTTVRQIEKSELVRINESTLQYFVVGRGFLKQMVRIIAGTLVGVGRGRISAEQVSRLLENGEELGRKEAGETAPPNGLFLEWVRYF